ncbi:MAG: hypothetical protein ACHQF2_11395 [Flavobacteriales bacterium]
MAKKPVKRIYSFSDGSLSELGDELVMYAERDLADMTAFGYDQPRIDAIKLKIANFKDFSSDEVFTGLMMEATEDKNTAITNMSEVAEGVVQRAVTKYDRNSPKVKSFGYTGYGTKSDSDKTTACRDVHKQGTAKLADLASEGLTVAILDDLRAKTILADDAITEKRKRVADRDEAVNTRITMGNDLYKDLVKLADTGKHLYEDTNEAKYNDYVIYDNIANTQTVTGAVPAASIHQPSVAVTASENEIEIAVTSGTLTVYFSDDPTDEPAPGQITATVDTANPFSGTAASLNWSAANNRLLFKNADAVNEVPFTVVVKE